MSTMNHRSHRPSTHRPQWRSTSLISLLTIPSISTLILSSVLLSHSSLAYIPAQPVNDTSSLNLTDSSTISIIWTDPEGVYSGGVSYQLRADVATGGTTSGALVHFTEASAAGNLSTTTPFIAFISCDANETNASEEWDIFTLARDAGAVSALLYTDYSESCLINQDYIQNFEKPLDVFATKTKDVAVVIDSQFSNTNASFYTFNASLLNMSATDVNKTLLGTSLHYKTYLGGTLVARNSTGQAEPINNPSSSTSSGSSSSSSSSSNKSKAMIAVYVIAGFICIMVSITLISIMQKALRPRRYNESDGNMNDGALGPRRQGLAQAIIDTFPLTKFTRTGSGEGRRAFTGEGVIDENDNHSRPESKRWESDRDSSVLLSERPSSADQNQQVSNRDTQGPMSKMTVTPRMSSDYRRSHSDKSHWRMSHESIINPTEASRRSTVSSLGTGRGDGNKGAAGGQSPLYQINIVDTKEGEHGNRNMSSSSPTRFEEDGTGTGLSQDLHSQSLQLNNVEDQCPICLLEFEDGDDLRILPCEGRHRFHQACIDPWLLRVSSSCPLCRKDFNPDAIPTSTSSSDSNPSLLPGPTDPSSVLGGATGTSISTRFSRYLALMRRERGAGAGRRGGSGGNGIGIGRRRDHGADVIGFVPTRPRETDQLGGDC